MAARLLLLAGIKQQLAAQYREAVEESRNPLIGAKALNAFDDEEVRARIEGAQRRCEDARRETKAADDI